MLKMKKQYKYKRRTLLIKVKTLIELKATDALPSISLPSFIPSITTIIRKTKRNKYKTKRSTNKTLD